MEISLCLVTRPCLSRIWRKSCLKANCSVSQKGSLPPAGRTDKDLWDVHSVKGWDKLGDKKQRQLSATSCSVYTTCKTRPYDTMSVRCTRSDLVWGGMWTSFLIQYGWPYDAQFIFCRSDLLPEVYTRGDNAAFANFVPAISRRSDNYFHKITVSPQAPQARYTIYSLCIGKLTLSF